MCSSFKRAQGIRAARVVELPNWRSIGFFQRRQLHPNMGRRFSNPFSRSRSFYWTNALIFRLESGSSGFHYNWYVSRFFVFIQETTILTFANIFHFLKDAKIK